MPSAAKQPKHIPAKPSPAKHSQASAAKHSQASAAKHSPASRPIQICRVLNGGSPPVARIIAKAPDGAGVLLDVEICRAACESAGWNVEYVNIQTDIVIGPVKTTANINIFIEHIDRQYAEKYPVKPTKGGFSSVVLVNQEWLFDWDMVAINNGVVPLYKTRYAERMVSPHVKTKGIYVGFGMYPWNAQPNPAARIPGLAIHIAGRSPMKGTLSLIYAMAEAPKYTGKPVVLIITVNDVANKYLFQMQQWGLRRSLGKLPAAFLSAMYDSAALLGMPEFKRGGSLDMANMTFNIIGDMYMINQFLDRKVIDFLQAAAWLAVCPSFMEGYGHYIDEARRSQINILTMNGPPMNELITDPTQLIRVGKPLPVRAYLPTGYTQYIQEVYPVEGYLPADPREFAAQIYREAHADRRAICAASAARSKAEAEQFAAQFIRQVLWGSSPGLCQR